VPSAPTTPVATMAHFQGRSARLCDLLQHRIVDQGGRTCRCARQRNSDTYQGRNEDSLHLTSPHANPQSAARTYLGDENRSKTRRPGLALCSRESFRGELSMQLAPARQHGRPIHAIDPTCWTPQTNATARRCTHKAQASQLSCQRVWRCSRRSGGTAARDCGELFRTS
jgi:hypothetical protein